MEKIEKYTTIILEWLKEQQEIKPFSENIEKLLLADKENRHYQLLIQGWQGTHFVHNVIFHLEVKPDGKVWIWLNQSDQKIASELEERGISKKDIVLGFQPPYYRKYTEFAEA